MKSSLLDIMAAMRQVTGAIEAHADDHDGVLDDLDEKLAARLDELELGAAKKVDALVAAITDYEARADMRRRAAAEMNRAAVQETRRAEALREYLRACMSAAGVDRVSGDMHVARIAKNGGKLPILLTCGAGELPARFRRISIEPDMDGIRAAIETGEQLPFAAYGDRGYHLRIR